jgi:hypothetical protein
MGVALLPFIDEKRLLEAVRPLEKTLTEQEKSQVRACVYACAFCASVYICTILDHVMRAIARSQIILF